MPNQIITRDDAAPLIPETHASEIIKELPTQSVALAMFRRLLAPEVVVRAAAEVPEEFDARFSALRREYEYRIYRSEVPDPFRDRFAVWVPGRLRLGDMRAGGRALVLESGRIVAWREGEGAYGDESASQASCNIVAGQSSVDLPVRGDGHLYNVRVRFTYGTDPFLDRLTFEARYDLRESASLAFLTQSRVWSQGS